jgi:hypothetical protein
MNGVVYPCLSPAGECRGIGNQSDPDLFFMREQTFLEFDTLPAASSPRRLFVLGATLTASRRPAHPSKLGVEG